TLAISDNSQLGDVSTGTAVTLNDGTLATTVNVGLFNGAAGTNDRAVVIGGSNGTIAPAAGTTLTVSGAISGTGKLIKTDAGTLAISNAVALQNTYSGGTLISSGTIALNDANANGAGL